MKRESKEISSSLGGQFTKLDTLKGYVVYYNNKQGWHISTASYGCAWTYKGFAKNNADRVVSWGWTATEAVVVDTSTNKIVYHTARKDDNGHTQNTYF
tara:strand:- start:722 stop:1015 length:294 start_codon:yes stop_codon:yes gene_type:complete